MKPRPNYKKQENKGKQRKASTTNPTNETKTKLQKMRPKQKQRLKSTTQSMAMLKLRKQNIQTRRKKNCKYPLCTPSLLQCVVLCSKEKKWVE